MNTDTQKQDGGAVVSSAGLGATVAIPTGWRELGEHEEVTRGDKFFYPPSGRWCDHYPGATSLRTVKQFRLRYIRRQDGAPNV